MCIHSLVTRDSILLILLFGLFSFQFHPFTHKISWVPVSEKCPNIEVGHFSDGHFSESYLLTVPMVYKIDRKGTI